MKRTVNNEIKPVIWKVYIAKLYMVCTYDLGLRRRIVLIFEVPLSWRLTRDRIVPGFCVVDMLDDGMCEVAKLTSCARASSAIVHVSSEG